MWINNVRVFSAISLFMDHDVLEDVDMKIRRTKQFIPLPISENGREIKRNKENTRLHFLMYYHLRNAAVRSFTLHYF
jgi:hypothetical protein